MATIKPIGVIYTDLPEKFGVPRQAGLVPELSGKVVMEPQFRQPEAFTDLNQFSHIWLLWQFSQCNNDNWHATVRPPRLGGNQRIGVFASRSPYRPNSLAMSCVRLVKIDYEQPDSPILYVAGIDMADQTPIFDIKPYIPVTDCHPEATQGYTAETRNHYATVDFPINLLAKLPSDKQQAALKLLQSDPRPGYDHSNKEYGLTYAGFNIRFLAHDDCITVISVTSVSSDIQKEQVIG